jgi:hypothetical protein
MVEAVFMCKDRLLADDAYIAKRMVENISCICKVMQKIAPKRSLESMEVIISAMEKPCPICLKNDYDLLKLRRHLREHEHEELVEYIIKNMGDRTVRPSGNDSAEISATFT